MPEDLSLPDQLLFGALSLLYKRYYAGQISRDDAAMEKLKLKHAHELQVKKLARYDRLARYYSQQQEAVYLAHGRYMKDRTPEHAELLSGALNGFVRLHGLENKEEQHENT